LRRRHNKIYFLFNDESKGIVCEYYFSIYIFADLKQIFAFILLVLHINFSMFIAQVDELDAFDKWGRQKEDVNSLVEYLADTFHIKHRPLKDSDDDNARYFHSSKFDDYNFSQLGVIKKEYFFTDKINFPSYSEKVINSIFLDIQGPPPKA
jgi:hypothetical protein